MWVVLLRPVLGSRRFPWRLFLQRLLSRYLGVWGRDMAVRRCLLGGCTTCLRGRGARLGRSIIWWLLLRSRQRVVSYCLLVLSKRLFGSAGRPLLVSTLRRFSMVVPGCREVKCNVTGLYSALVLHADVTESPPLLEGMSSLKAPSLVVY
jgi:hypothetical protein